METREIALLAAKALDDKRGKDITVLKVDEMTVITDYMVIVTGRSVPQVKALADNVEEELAKMEKELAYFEGFLRTVLGKLSNERFVSGAPAAVVENERNKQRDAEAKIAALKERIAALKK